MKKLFTLLLIPVLSFCQIAIPDQNFENKLIQLGYDNILDGQIGVNYYVQELDLSGLAIQDLTGIQAFYNLETLDISYNLLTQLDLTALYEVTSYSSETNPSININLDFNPNLNFLDLSGFYLESLSIIGTSLSCIQTNFPGYLSNAYPSFSSFFTAECGCTNPEASNYEFSATGDDGSCIIYGCMDSLACNFDENATNEISGICEYPEEYYDCDGNCLIDLDGDGVCHELEILGCMDSEADNFNPLATDDDSCYYTIYGCTDQLACNYDELANEDFGGVLCDYSFEYYDCDGECLLDSDLDNVCDELDNCPENYNPIQEDFDFDDVGDACDGLSLNEAPKKSKLIRITDILGRDIKEDDNEKIRLYIYDDGFVDRKIKL